MTHQADRVRWLLWGYPKDYRDHRGQEILSTLLDSTANASRIEFVRVSADVLVHGLRLRSGTASDQPGGRVLTAAALPGLTMAAAGALGMLVAAQILPMFRQVSFSWGPGTAIWPAISIAWALGACAALLFPRHQRAIALGCVVTTVGTSIGLFVAHVSYVPFAFAVPIALTVPTLLAQRVPGTPFVLGSNLCSQQWM